MRKFKLKTLLLAAVLSAGALLAACGEEQAFPEGPEHLRVYIDSTEQYLVLQEPEHEFFRVENLLVDGKTGGYAVIYDTSDISDEIDPDFGKLIDETSHIEVQFFDKNGKYLNLLHTDLENYYRGVENFYDGVITFGTSGFERSGRVMYDLQNGEYLLLQSTHDYTIKSFYFEGDITVVVSEEHDRERGLEFYNVDRYDRTLKTASASFENTDLNFSQEAFPYEAPNMFEFSAQENTVTISSEKVSHFVNLNTGEHVFERHYTLDMLSTLHATSPDGLYNIYTIPSEGLGVEDCVSMEQATCEITFITQGWVARVFFSQGDEVLIYANEINIYNYKTGELLVENAIDVDGKIYNGITWDDENQCFVGIYTYYDDLDEQWCGDVIAEVYSPHGEIISTTETGVRINAIYKFMRAVYDLELVGDGTLKVTSGGQEITSLRYQ